MTALVVGAALLHGVIALALALLGGRVEARAADRAVPWVWGHVYLPMLRAAALVLFVLVAYPALYGVVEVPRYAIVAIVIASAILTPTPDVFNQMLMAGPLIVLYAIGLGAAALLGKKKEKE